MKKRVLIACEFSATVRTEFEKLGFEVWSCDLLDTEKPGNHYKGNVLDILNQSWDLMIGHPPCTYLTNSGVRWLYNKDKTKNTERWLKMRKATQFFRQLLDADIPLVAIENPIPHKYAVKGIGRKYDQIVQPWQFGHGESKATCFWLKGLPELQPTNIVEGREGKVWRMPPSKDRWKKRSLTYKGVAEAMAQQWGKLLIEKPELVEFH